MKTYSITHNVGHAKYLVSFHDGEAKHSDGSNFFDVRIFNNKLSLNDFIKQLTDNGYELPTLQ